MTVSAHGASLSWDSYYADVLVDNAGREHCAGCLLPEGELPGHEAIDDTLAGLGRRFEEHHWCYERDETVKFCVECHRAGLHRFGNVTTLKQLADKHDIQWQDFCIAGLSKHLGKRLELDMLGIGEWYEPSDAVSEYLSAQNGLEDFL